MIPVRGVSGIKTVSHAIGRPEAEALRPIYRKGFPGKKSMRAEIAYAPERFDLTGDNSLVLKSLNGTIVQRTRPYSSNASNRKGNQPSSTTKAPVANMSLSMSNITNSTSVVAANTTTTTNMHHPSNSGNTNTSNSNNHAVAGPTAESLPKLV